MLIPSHLSTLRSSSSEFSSLRPQAFRIHRPVIKAKHRSFVPTASSLLVNIFERSHSIEIADYEITEAHSMEAQFRTHEIPERPNAADSLTLLNSKGSPRYNSKITCACIKSHRTEDIFVREDEDGIRSHFCPLKKTLDGARDENEDYPDEPMRLEFVNDHFFKDCSLKSEDIPCLVAEKPTLSECQDENAGSDVDASTSMIYALTLNQQSTKIDASLDFLWKHKIKHPSQRKLDEKTMASWIGESSDDNEYYISDKDTRILREKYDTEEESDMEEFEERKESPEEKNEVCDKLKFHSDHKGENNSYKDTPGKSPNTRIKENSKYADEHSNMVNFQNTRVEMRRKDSSGFETTGENKLQKNDVPKQNFETDNFSQLLDDQVQSDDSLKTEVEHAILNATRLYVSKEEKTEFSEKKLAAGTKDNLKPEACHLKDLNSRTVDKTDEDLTEDNSASKNETNSSKNEENESNVSHSRSCNAEGKERNILIESQVTQENVIAQKEEKRDNLAMEPVVLNSRKASENGETQPDLATALRFMTEIYHTKDEEELYSDTLSTIDLPSEVPRREKSKELVISNEYQDTQKDETTSGLDNLPSPSKSSPFETVLTDDQRTVKRSRNKFSKFFQSFKKRLVKKA